MNEVVDPLHGSPVSYCLSYWALIIFQCLNHLPNWPIMCCFALPVVMRDTGIALLSQSTLNSQATMVFALKPLVGRNSAIY